MVRTHPGSEKAKSSKTWPFFLSSHLPMQSLLEYIERQALPSFDRVQFSKTSPTRTVGLQHGALATFIVQKFLQEKKQKASILVCLNNLVEMETLYGDLYELLGEEVGLFPHPDLKPYEWREPFGQVREQRMAVFERALSGIPGIIVTTPLALAEKLPHPKLFHRDILQLAKGMEISLSDMRETLNHLGFYEESVVEDLGQFAIRGGILDIYPYGRENPLRLEWFGDEIESIREFDIFSQRSKKTLEEVSLWPMTEWCFHTKEIEEGLLKHSKNFSSESEFDAETFRLLEKQDRTGLTWQKPFFSTCDSHLLDFFKGPVNVLFESFEISGPSSISMLKLFDQYHVAYEKAKETGHWVAEPQRLLYSEKELLDKFKQLPSIHLSSIHTGLESSFQFQIEDQSQGGGNLESVQEELEAFRLKGYEVCVLVPNEGQGQRLKKITEDYPLNQIIIGKLSTGFVSHEDHLVFYTDHQIFNRFQRTHATKSYKGGSVSIPHFEALSKGDVIVHQEYGLGKFLGIKRLQVEDHKVDCLLLAYHGNDKLTIPVTDLSKIQKYSSKEGASPSLSKLGGTSWENLKAKTKKSIVELAQDLLELYARREAIKGYAYPPDGHLQAEFEEAFEYTPTPDQLSAIADTKKDMEKPVPMDRLICGDVGFGKTEVAMRAVFKAVTNKKQVAVLAPTTLLVSQHFSSFSERFSNWPVRIEYINRFRSSADEKEILKATARGEVDVLIGTHRLLSSDVVFKDLGLIVVDEEQKFGVQQKEKLKKVRAEVDVLSMSATPIPRSLYMSLMGARNFSVILTPPRNRLPIQTTVLEWKNETIKEAIQREISRGGQCFVVHNRVNDLAEVVESLEVLVPHFRIGMAHGQMPEKDLERVMTAFIRREYDILVSTSIIESGIDLPNVNTIIINKSHHFGLSQLFQMRGRVGRSGTQAYCLLICPPKEKFSDEAKKRLYSMQRFTELGSGYQLAMRDLEIRGAGNILGEQQSGHIMAVGFDTYCTLLKEAMTELQGGQVDPQIEPELEIPLSCFIPEDYVPDGLQRIALYQKLSDCESQQMVEELQLEFKDRFGVLPEELENLLISMRLRLLCKEYGIQKLSLRKTQLSLTFAAHKQPKLENIPIYMGKIKEPLRFLNESPLRMVIDLQKKTNSQLVQEAVKVLGNLFG